MQPKRKFRHYMLVHKRKLVVGANQIRYLLSRPARPIGKDSALVVTALRLCLRYSPFFAIKDAIKGQMQIYWPIKRPSFLQKFLVISNARLEDGQWTLYFDESSTVV